MSTRSRKIIFPGVERGRCVGLTTLPPSVSRLSIQCGIFNNSRPYRPPRPVTTIALLFFNFERTSNFAHNRRFSQSYFNWRLGTSWKEYIMSNFVGMCIVYLRTKLHMPHSSVCLVIVTNLKPKYRFHAAAILFSYILQKKKFKYFCEISIQNFRILY
jgi:hypothetical protein